MTEAIVTRELIKTYGDGVRALDGLTFAVEEGTVFGLLGPNGAGKSTSVKILATLTRPDAGRASVAGLDVVAKAAAVRRVIGLVGQRSAVDREGTVRENIRLQGRVHGLRGRRLERRGEELIQSLGLTEVAGRLARELSGGMQRRLDVAMGLVNRPRVLFLDEPTTGLDPEVRSLMWRLIERLAREEGITVLLTTHYLEEADRLASRLAIVDRGRIVTEGSPEELKSELRGDAIHIDLADGDTDGSAGLALERLSDITELTLDGSHLRARVENGGRTMPAVLAALEEHGLTVASVTVARPSLDDVYLRHTGRAFADADRDGSGAPAET
jgi:ABC-2 type transport system ATP-binding protein